MSRHAKNNNSIISPSQSPLCVIHFYLVGPFQLAVVEAFHSQNDNNNNNNNSRKSQKEEEEQDTCKCVVSRAHPSPSASFRSNGQQRPGQPAIQWPAK